MVVFIPYTSSFHHSSTGNSNIVFSKEIEFTDFPLDEIALFYTDAPSVQLGVHASQLRPYMAKISTKIFLRMVETLLPRCKNIREPFVVERYPGDHMNYEDFVYMLREPIQSHRQRAEAFLLDWMMSGSKKRCTGFVAFVVSEALYDVKAAFQGTQILASDTYQDSGPPYEENLAKNVAQNIMNFYFDKVMDNWVEAEAKSAYEAWKSGYDEYHNGPKGW